MHTKIDTTLLPPVIRDAVDPDILDRAQSIEWSIDRDHGQNERGFLDGSHEDYLSSQNLMYKTHGNLDKSVDWISQAGSLRCGRDSGFEQTPTTPSLGLEQEDYANVLVDGSNEGYSHTQMPKSGPVKYHPSGKPFPIYSVNQGQLKGDVFFEAAPKARPGERTVHYEKSSRILNEHELNALGLDDELFAPGTNTLVDEQEQETIETSNLKGGPEAIRRLYETTMRNQAGEYFDRQRARSLSPNRQMPLDGQESLRKTTTIFGSVEEIDRRDQEFYPYRDAHQGKPLPGDNEYGTWGSRKDEERQWKLSNGQWVRVAEPKPKPAEPKREEYLAERVKCKPPKKVQIARAAPQELAEPETGKDDSLDDDDDDSLVSTDYDDSPLDDNASLDLDQPIDLAKPLVDSALDRSPPNERSLDSPSSDDDTMEPLVREKAPANLRSGAPKDPDDDLEALRDRYRPKPEVAAKTPKTNAPKILKPNSKYNDGDKSPETGTILLKPPTPPPVEIKCEPIQPTYIEMKKPLKHEGEEEKMMEDPNLMWMRMGPAQYGPPYGTLKKRKGREEEWIGPPCELCHKQIEERRCMLAENRKFHCWHFSCCFCLKTLKPADFLIAEADKKPYCLNCHKREFPEISLVNLHLEE